MLACLRASGQCTRSVFGGFAANELAVRIKRLHPQSQSHRPASCGWNLRAVVAYKPLLDGARRPTHKPVSAESCSANSPLAILISRGASLELARRCKEGTPLPPCNCVEGTTLLIFFIPPARLAPPKGVVRQTAASVALTAMKKHL